MGSALLLGGAGVRWPWGVVEQWAEEFLESEKPGWVACGAPLGWEAVEGRVNVDASRVSEGRPAAAW